MKLYVVLTTFLAIFVSGCVSTTDYFDELQAACQAPNPDAPGSAHCLSTLESKIPFDRSGNDTFAGAPAGFKKSITDAYRRILLFPLKFPSENRILGVAPYSIPASIVDIYRNEENLNKSLINYLFDQVQDIVYSADMSASVSGEYLPVLGLDGIYGGQMTLYPSFGSNPWPSLGQWFGRASTLVHESRHGDGMVHEYCSSQGGFHCDGDLKGPYGFSIVYFELLINGSAITQPDGSPPLLSKSDVQALGISMCLTLRDRIKFLPQELKNLISTKPNFSCYSITYDWLMRQEGLPPQP